MDSLKRFGVVLGGIFLITNSANAASDEQRARDNEMLIMDAAQQEWVLTRNDWLTFDPIAMIQFRYVADVQDQLDGQREKTLGFENSRTRLGLKAKLEEHNIDLFVWTGHTGIGASLLLDAWANWKADENFSLKVGQFKLPIWNEWTVSETKQTFVERSVLDARFAPHYAQGIMGTWRDDTISLSAVFSDGMRGWNRFFPGDIWAVTGRFDWLIQGDWSQRADFNSFRDESPFTVLGIAGHFQDGGTLAGSGGTNIYTNDTRITQVTADFQWGFSGASIYAAVIGNYEESPGALEYHQFGALLQGQVFVTDDIELFARYEFGDLDGQAAAFSIANPGATTNEELAVLTVGATKFIAGHALKVTGDLGFSFDEVSGAWAGTRRGWQGDDAGAGAQVVFRAQIQALF